MEDKEKNRLRFRQGGLEVEMTEEENGDVLFFVQQYDTMGMITVPQAHREAFIDVFDLAARALEAWR